jgi:DNA-binding LacI/PurR family transcriptional regulator
MFEDNFVAKRPTIIDVARLAGVSKATVARVINQQDDIVREETRERVMAAVAQLGYERNAVAGSLRTDKTYMVGLSIPDITNPFWPEVARGVQDTIDAHDYTTVMFNTDWKTERERKYLKMVRRNRFDGLIINPTNMVNADFDELGMPIVILGSGDEYQAYSSVGSDTTQGMLDALDYLYELGHRCIGLIAGRSQRRKVSSRYHAYTAFHARKQLKLDDSLVISSEFSAAAGVNALHELMNRSRPPTAILAANDIIAINAMRTAQEMGLRIPEDLSIVGMDDIYAASTTSPSLTTIAKPKYDIGVQAANLLLDQIHDDDAPPVQHLLLGCELVVRGSTAPPR